MRDHYYEQKKKSSSRLSGGCTIGIMSEKKNQFLVLAENRFWLYILLCFWSTIVVVLCCCFWFWREIVLSVTYVLSVQYSCAVLSVSSVWQVLDHYYDRKKKVLVVCLAGARSLLRPEKKVLVVCLAGYAVVSIFGSGGK